MRIENSAGSDRCRRRGVARQADHRLCAVEDWVKQHYQTLSKATGWSIGLKDTSDDRLASLLEVIGREVESREQIEEKLGERMIRGYELPTEVARCDTSSFSVYHQIESEDEDKSLLRFGHSKNHRPDLRQYRQLLGTIDPAGVPLVSETLAGNGADDSVYLPTWHRSILKRYRVLDYFLTEIDPETVTRYASPGRPSRQNTNPTITSIQFRLQFKRQTDAISQAEQLTGWRIYVTNVVIEQLSLSQAVVYYRDQWQLEHGFHRFKRGQLPALPIYLTNEDRIIGLMFLLTIALRCFTLIEFQVRRKLQTQQDEIAGLYAGNPKRKTPRPTAEQLLAAFCGITLYHHRDGTSEITPLNELQLRILALMNLPEAIYALPILT